MEVGVPGFRFGVSGFGFRVPGLGFGIGGFKVWGLNFRVQGLGSQYQVQALERRRDLGRVAFRGVVRVLQFLLELCI